MNLKGHYEMRPDEHSRLLTEDEQGRLCSQPNCKNPAVFVLLRRVYRWRSVGSTTRRWFCCHLNGHNYGREVRGDQVFSRYWVFDEERP